MHRVVADYSNTESVNSNIKVFVRARPLADETESVDFITPDPDDERKMTIRDPDSSSKKYGEVSFQFDHVFWANATQSEIFEAMCKPQVEYVMNGYNCCCFAYGQTGSGKTYSMFGEDGDIRGVIPRCVENLFQSLQAKVGSYEVALVCSFLEIYNDQIRDLGKAYLVAMGVESSKSAALLEKTSEIFESLSGKRGNPYFAPVFHKNKTTGDTAEFVLRPGLKEVLDEYNVMNYEIREDSEGNVFVKDLSLIPVSSLDEVMSLINAGLKVRATHETKMNANSSRSHTVFTITVLQRDKITGHTTTGMLNLIDLAGSERLKKSESIGIRLKETLHINTSLTALGKVIMALDPSLESSHIPYRDSKLTRILQNSLGGNSYTTLLAAIHSKSNQYDECLSTLQFANRCRNVRNNPRVNYVSEVEDKDRRIRQLAEEVNQLRSKVGMFEVTGSPSALRSSMPAGHRSRTGSGNNVKIVVVKMLTMLKKLGLDAAAGIDGSIVLNGKKIIAEELAELQGDQSIMSEGDDNTFLSMSKAGEMGPGGGGTASGISRAQQSANIEKLKKQLVDLQEINTDMQTKAKERKALMEEQGKQINELSTELTKCQTTIKHKEFEYLLLHETKERNITDLKKDFESQHKCEIESLLQNNKTIMSQRQPTDALADQAYNAMLKKFEDSKAAFSGNLRQEFESHLLVMNRSRNQEIEHIHMQYKHWLTEKDKMIEDFVERFNTYRTKKSEQIRMCEKEIVTLYNYTEQLDKLVDGVEQGKFYLRQTQGHNSSNHPPKSITGMINTATFLRDANFNSGGSFPSAAFNNKLSSTRPPQPEPYATGGAVIIPKASRPLHPLARPTDSLSLTKKIVQRFRDREFKLEKVKEEAFQRTLTFATKGVTSALKDAVDANVESRLKDLLTLPNSTINNNYSSSRNHLQAAKQNAILISSAEFKGVHNGGGTDGKYGTVSRPNSPSTRERESSSSSSRPHTQHSFMRSARIGMSSSSHENNGNNNAGGGGNVNPGFDDNVAIVDQSESMFLSLAPSQSSQGIINNTEAKAIARLYSAREEISQLQNELNLLKNEKRLEQVNVEKLTQEIASNETICYIKSLEADKEKSKKRINELSSQLQSLKSANAALQRKREGGGTGGGHVRGGGGLGTGGTGREMMMTERGGTNEIK